jgi:hypothetical protein
VLYDAGPAASVWGNIGIAATFAALHRFVAGIVLRQRRPTRRTMRSGGGGGADAATTVNVVKEDDVYALQQAMADVRFPSVSIAVVFFVMPGVAYAAASCFSDSSSIGNVATGVLGLAISVVATIVAMSSFLAATASPTISSTGGAAGSFIDQEAIVQNAGEVEEVEKADALSLLKEFSTRPSPDAAATVTMLARQRSLGVRRFSVFIETRLNDDVDDMKRDVALAAVVHHPSPRTSHIPFSFFMFLKLHSSVLSLIAGLPLRPKVEPFRTSATCVAQYAIMAAWAVIPVIGIAIFRCCRGSFPFRTPLLNVLVTLTSVITAGLVVAVALFYEGPEDRRSAADSAIGVLGWVLVALHTVQALIIILPVVISCVSFLRSEEEGGRRRRSGRGGGGELVEGGGETLVMEDYFHEGDGSVMVRYADRAIAEREEHRQLSSNNRNWLQTLPTPKEFYLGVPSSAFLHHHHSHSSSSRGGDVRSIAMMKAIWYDAVPLETKLEVARLDAFICHTLVELEDAAKQKKKDDKDDDVRRRIAADEPQPDDADTLPASAADLAVATAAAEASNRHSCHKRAVADKARKQKVRDVMEAMVERITLVSSITAVTPGSLL